MQISTFGFLRLVLSLVILVVGVGFTPPRAEAISVQTVPNGFTDTQVANPGGQVTAFAWTPDGRMLITTQGGTLRVVENNALLGTPAVNFNTAWPQTRICTDFERGLLGIAIDPDFTNNNYIYLYYTVVVTPTAVTDCGSGAGRNSPNVVNRVSRFTLSGNTAITTTELVLIDNIRSLNGNHNGGDLNFGKDGYLYVTTGDAGTGGSLARLKTNLAGKILRVNSDGTPPTSNPFYNEAGARRCGEPGPANYTATTTCREIFAYGLRNPFRFAFDPNTNGNTTRFFINDVGQGTWEEIDESLAGADYGWNVREGPCPAGQNCTPNLPSAYTDPIHWYGRSIGTVVTGGAFMPNGLTWPSQYNGVYFFADGTGGGGTIFYLTPNGSGGYTRSTFGTGLGYVVHMRFGPSGNSQALYYSRNGQVRRITLANQAPTAVIDASPTFGNTPLPVTFNGAGSSDPNGDPLTYQWNFGNGITETTSAPTTVYTYTVVGVYTASLQVRDSVGLLSTLDTIQIQPGNTPPVPEIQLPTDGTEFSVGEIISLQGSAIDPQSQPFTLSWNVLLWHVDVNTPGADHYHPFHNASGATSSFAAPAPEDFNATQLSYVTVRLTATDALGLSASITHTLQPNKVMLTFATQPSGLQVKANERTVSDSGQVVAWEGFNINVSAPTQFVADVPYFLVPFTTTTPITDSTITATFVPAQLVYLPIIQR